ncbi:hypothetical protein [Cohnella sp. 56]|uniref:hypothetical protein n=1 Tax=Cohnella sp. 56 TaxID=3113722 RepID=UPI0030E8E6B8
MMRDWPPGAVPTHPGRLEVLLGHLDAVADQVLNRAYARLRLEYMPVEAGEELIRLADARYLLREPDKIIFAARPPAGRQDDDHAGRQRRL